jgi:hypothetical protein
MTGLFNGGRRPRRADDHDTADMLAPTLDERRELREAEA